MTTPLPTSEGDSADSYLDEHPFAWILVPICLFFVVGISISYFQFRKRNRIRWADGAYPQGQDLEGLGRYQARRQQNARRQQPGGRARARRGFGIGSREEGLNELGEAPPMYTAATQKATEESPDTEVPPPIHASFLRTPPPQSVAARDDLASHPPAYAEAPQNINSASHDRTTPNNEELPVPPPAILHA
ncbi:hypothetical protein BX600DRAFT_458273 [Xylariales sp. PMI_506]|nr:hypothetical protein BX600DRAFT_458273 [Xylariales sp. PMI_506]